MMPLENTATLFTDKNSWVQRLHPFTKLSFLLFVGATVYLGPFGCKYNGLLLLVIGVVVASGKLLKEAGKALARIVLPLSLFMISIHGLLYPENKTILFEVYGIAIYQEGLLYAFITLLKLTAVLTASLVFVLSTHPADLITAISGSGKFRSLAYLLGSPLLLLASMRARIEIIQAAQRARGLHTDGNLVQRFCSLAPLVIPLVVGSIVEVEQRSIALEVRGFKSTSVKTSLQILVDSPFQRRARWLMLTAASGFVFLGWVW